MTDVALIACAACRRHHRAEAPACPFCGGPARAAARRTAFVAGVAAAALSLSACYGAPAPRPEPEPEAIAPVDSTQPR